MTSRHRQDDKDQVRLPLAREDRFEALRRLDPKQVGIGRRQWLRVVDLLIQVEVTAKNGDCHAYAQTLAARMAEKVGVSKATLHRARRAAEAAGLLTVSHRHNGDRQLSNHWLVQWDRIVLLSRANKTDTGACQTDTPPCQTDTLIRNNLDLTLTELRSVDASVEVDQINREWDGPIAPPDPDEARRFGRRVGPPKSRRDIEAAWKLTALKAVLGERWFGHLTQGVQATPGIRTPWAWVMRTAANGTRECPGPGRTGLAQLMDRVEGPPPGWPGKSVIAERQCAATLDEC